MTPLGTAHFRAAVSSPHSSTGTRVPVGLRATFLHCSSPCHHPISSKISSRKSARTSAHRSNCTASRARQDASDDQVVPSKALQRASVGVALGMVFWTLLGLFASQPAHAIHTEPTNALSVPTWMIHISSVIEWTVAMILVWRYGEITGNKRWKGMTWGMMPLFAGALTACTYHFFYNSKDLDFLVTIQASLTWIGNATLWAAAYRIYNGSVDIPEQAR